MTARQLLNAYFSGRIHKGEAYKEITTEIIYGTIEPRARYIQTFKDNEFSPYNADACILTTADEKCYLYKIES